MSTPITDTTPDDAPKGIILSDRAYDILKDVDLVLLPAAGTAYAATAGILHLPYAVEVIGLVAVAVFILGVILKISSVQHKATAAIAAAKAAAVVAPVVTVDPADSSKVVVTDPALPVDPAVATEVTPTPPSQ